MTSKGYINDFYKQFEELNKKMDKLISENKFQALTIANLNAELKAEKEKNAELLNKIEKLLEERDKYKNHSDKNSSNSSKPSSTDISRPKKSGANLYNSRKSTKAKIGGQNGHEGHNLSKERIEKIIQTNNIKKVVIPHTIKGNSNKTPDC